MVFEFHHESDRKYKKYIIIDKEYGVFLGLSTLLSSDGEEVLKLSPDSKNVTLTAIFSSQDPFGLPEAIAFESEKETRDYINQYLSELPELDCFFAPVLSLKNEHYVSFIEIIKSGFEQYAKDMLDNSIDEEEETAQ